MFERRKAGIKRLENENKKLQIELAKFQATHQSEIEKVKASSEKEYYHSLHEVTENYLNKYAEMNMELISAIGKLGCHCKKKK